MVIATLMAYFQQYAPIRKLKTILSIWKAIGVHLGLQVAEGIIKVLEKMQILTYVTDENRQILFGDKVAWKWQGKKLIKLSTHFNLDQLLKWWGERHS